MNGLVAMAERLRARPGSIDAIVAASAISFGFVFVHPFMDGNGRLHRYLIHEQLSSAGFTPKGLILPVSTVILANLDRYRETLESFSRPYGAQRPGGLAGALSRRVHSRGAAKRRTPLRGQA